MLTGRSVSSPGFVGDRTSRPSDWPSIASIVGDAVSRRSNNLPPAIVLPERLIHWSGGVIPGAYGGLMGRHRDPFFIEASPYGNPFWRGAYPEYTFANETKKSPKEPDARVYQAPNISLSPDLNLGRVNRRVDLLRELDQQRSELERSAAGQSYDDHRQSAISLLASRDVRRAFDVTNADEATQLRYGRNSFGWSLLMAKRLVESGVNLVQVNLGSNETWDNHGDIFHRLKNKLLPPTDRALCALLDDLQSTGLLASTLVVMAGEFGAGVPGGTVIGSSDKIAAYPASNPQRPENMAATIYHALGIPETAAWHDELNRPHHLYHGQPIAGLV